MSIRRWRDDEASAESIVVLSHCFGDGFSRVGITSSPEALSESGRTFPDAALPHYHGIM